MRINIKIRFDTVSFLVHFQISHKKQRRENNKKIRLIFKFANILKSLLNINFIISVFLFNPPRLFYESFTGFQLHNIDIQ